MINCFLATELNFDKTVMSVSPMKDGIAFEIVFVAIVKYVAVESFGIDAKVSYAQIFKYESERFGVAKQIARADIECGRCNGRIREVTRIRRTNSGL